MQGKGRKRTFWVIVWGLWACFGVVLAQNEAHIELLLNELKNLKNNDLRRAKVLNQLSAEYLNIQTDKALEMAEEAQHIAQRLGDDRETALALRQMGTAFRQKSRLIEAQKSLYLALALEERNNNKQGVALCLLEVGLVYRQRKAFKEAIQKFSRASQLFEEIGDRQGTVRIWKYLAEVYFQRRDYEEAMHFAEQGIEIAKAERLPEQTVALAKLLAEAYAKQQKYEQAFQYQQMYIDTNDSLRAASQRLEIQLIERRYRQERQAAELAARRARELRQQQERDGIQYSLIGGIFALLFISIFIIGRFDLPTSYIESIIFITLFLLFRFIVVMLMPFADSYSDGSPLVVFGVNVGLAILFMPAHNFLERLLKKKVIEENTDEEKVPLRHWLNKKMKKVKKN